MGFAFFSHGLFYFVLLNACETGFACNLLKIYKICVIINSNPGGGSIPSEAKKSHHLPRPFPPPPYITYIRSIGGDLGSTGAVRFKVHAAGTCVTVLKLRRKHKCQRKFGACCLIKSSRSLCLSPVGS